MEWARLPSIPRRSAIRRRLGTALLVLVPCVGAQRAVAQMPEGHARTTIGGGGGLNLATYAGTDATGLKTRTAFYAGAAATVPLGPTLFFQPQALFSMQGMSIPSSDGSYVWRFNYVQVPMFLGLRVPVQGSGIRPHVMAGPYLAIKVGCTEARPSGTTDECGHGNFFGR